MWVTFTLDLENGRTKKTDFIGNPRLVYNDMIDKR
jgi:hypothetical protein